MVTPPRRNISHAGLALLACCSLGLPCFAQTQDPKKKEELRNWDPIEKGLNPNGDLYPVKYTIDDKGRLWLSPSPSAGGGVAPEDDKELLFPERLRQWNRIADNFGLLGFIRYTFTGNQDLLSLTDADYLFRKLRFGRSSVELRQRLAIVPTGKTPGRKQCAEMDRLLAVRLVQQQKVKGAKAELQLIVKDANADPFLRIAAQEALATLEPEKFKVPRRKGPDIKKLLAELPAGCQAIVTIDQTKVPRWPDLSRFFRTSALITTLGHVRMAGGTASPAIWAGATKLADITPLLPYEIGRRLGNARLLRFTSGVRFVAKRKVPHFFARWDGMIPAPKLKLALQQEGYKVTEANGESKVQLNLLLDLVFSKQQLTLRSEGFPMEEAGKDAEKLLAAGFGNSALWLHVADGAALLRQVKGTPAAAVLPKVTRGTLTASFAKEADVHIRLHLPVGREAIGVLRQLETMVKTGAQAARGFEQELLGKVLKGFELAEDEDDDKRLLVSWKPGDLTIAAVLKILGDEGTGR